MKKPTKNIITIFLLLIAVILSAWFFNLKTRTLEGSILKVDLENRLITLNNKKGDYKIILDDNTKLLDEQGVITFLSYYQRDFKIVAYGKYLKSHNFSPKRIKILKMPNIVLISPDPYSDIAQDFVITGKARVFENTFNIKIVDFVTKENLLDDIITANAPDVGQYGDFMKAIHLPDYNRQSIYVTLYDASAKDGKMQDAIGFELYLRGHQPTGTKKVKIFFNNNNLDPEVSCNKVFGVVRSVEDKLAIGKITLEALLKGVSKDEEKQGYTTSIPNGVVVNKLSISNGVALVDFNKKLEEGVGGSCRVSAIRAQITETLKQFPSVQKVVISIDGRTEDILQP